VREEDAEGAGVFETLGAALACCWEHLCGKAHVSMPVEYRKCGWKVGVVGRREVLE
jgi:hypothetical protein